MLISSKKNFHIWRWLYKLKTELPYDPAIPILVKYLEKTIIWKNIWTPMFIAALFITTKTQKEPKCPSTDEWIKKMWYIYKMEYYSAIKGWNNAISNNMNGPRDCHTEWSKSEKETYHILSLICGLKKKKLQMKSKKAKAKSLSRVRLFATPWTVAYQAPPSMGFSRQEHWSGLLYWVK